MLASVGRQALDSILRWNLVAGHAVESTCGTCNLPAPAQATALWVKRRSTSRNNLETMILPLLLRDLT
jgi:hypothetical protein